MADNYAIDAAINNAIINHGLGEAERAGGTGRGGKGGGWLVALATAMGGLLGDRAAKMVHMMGKLEALNAEMDRLGDLPNGRGKDQALQENSRQFQVALTQFQAEAQMFSILSNASSTALKSIGEGMTSVARKQ